MTKTLRGLLLFTLALMFGAVSGHAQTQQTSVQIAVNAGNPSWATFVFGHTVDGEPGTTELLVQCDLHRAELITNYDVYGMQMGSQFFYVSCPSPTITFLNGFRQFSYTVNGLPLMESLEMTGVDEHGNTITESLSLGIATLAWTATSSGRHWNGSGSATIMY